MKKYGTNKVPKMVAATMPPNTVKPKDTRLPAPAPVAKTNGNTPKINESASVEINAENTESALWSYS